MQGQWVHAGQDYAFWITDPMYETECLPRTNGIYLVGHRYMAIDLGEPFSNAIYKLVAAIIEKTGR